MKVLSLDISTNVTGFAAMDDSGLIEYGGLSLKEKQSDTASNSTLYNFGIAMSELMEKHKPDKVITENIYLGKNVSTVIVLAMMSGIARFIAFKYGVECYKLYPKSVDIHLGVETHLKRDARKKRIVELINKRFGLKLKIKENDIADAIAMASCAMYKIRKNEEMKTI